MAEEIKIILNTEVKHTGRPILDLSSDFTKLQQLLVSAAVGSEAFNKSVHELEDGVKKLSAPMKDVAKHVASNKKEMKEFVTAVKKDIKEAEGKFNDYDRTVVRSTDDIIKLTKAEQVLGTDVIGTNTKLQKQEAALLKLIEKQRELARTVDKGKAADKATKQEAFVEVNQKVITSAQAYLRTLASMQDTVGALTTALNQMGTAKGMKVFDILNSDGQATVKILKALDAEMAVLQGRIEKPRSKKQLSEDSVRYAQFKAASDGIIAVMAKEDAARERSASIAQRTSGRMITYKKQELSSASKSASAASSNDGLASRLGSKDAFILSNMARLGVVNPQIAQLSYFLQAVTSTGMLATVAVVGTAGAIVALGNASVKAAAELQQYQVTLQGLATHGWDAGDKNAQASMDLGKSVSAGMIEYASSSIYAFDKIAAGTEKLVGYGIDMRVVNNEMKMLGDLALGDSKRLENLAIAYGQVYGQGKARAQEMYQFVNAGIPIFDALAKSLGKTTADIMDMTRRGEISFDMIRGILKELTADGGRYHDLMQKIATMSFNGQFTMFMNNMKVMLADLGNNILPLITNALADANKAIAEFKGGASLKDIIATANSEERLSGKGLSVYDAYSVNAMQDAYDKLTAKQNRAKMISSITDIERGGIPSNSLGVEFLALRKAVEKIYVPAAGLSDNEKRARSMQGALMPFNNELLSNPYQVTMASATSASGSAQVEEMKLRAKWLDSQTQNINALLDFLTKKLGVDATVTTDLKENLIPYTVESSIGASALGRQVSPGEEFFSGPTEKFFQSLQATLLNLDRTAMTPEELRTLADITKWLEKTKVPLTGGAQDTDIGISDQRKYELPVKITDLTNQLEVLTELNPLWQNYVEILQMKRRDMAGNDGMDAKTAEQLETDARGLILATKAASTYQQTFQALYAYKVKYKAFSEDEIKAAAEQLKLKMKETDVTEEYKTALSELMISLSSAGLSAADATGLMQDLTDAASIPDDAQKGLSVLLDNYERLSLVLGVSEDKAKDFAQTVKEVAKLYGNDVAAQFIKGVKEVNNLLAHPTRFISSDVISKVVQQQKTAEFMTATRRGDASSLPSVFGGQILSSGPARGRTEANPAYPLAKGQATESIFAMYGYNREDIEKAGKEFSKAFALGVYLEEIEAETRKAALIPAEDIAAIKEAEEKLKALVKQFEEARDSATGLADSMAAARSAWSSGTIAGRSPGTEQAFRMAKDTAWGRYLGGEAGGLEEFTKSTGELNKYNLEGITGIPYAQGRSSLKIGTAFTKGISGTPEMSLDKLAELQRLAAEAKDNPLSQIEGTGENNLWEKAAADVEKYERALAMAATSGELLKGVLKDMAQQSFAITTTAMSDSMYELGKNLREGNDAFENFDDILKAWSNNMINMVPSILLSAAQGAFAAGNWQMGIGLLAASGFSSLISGLLGTKEQDDNDKESAEMRALENLKDQFQIMIQQFQANILYLDAARGQYASARQQAIVSGYANGDVFNGSTGLTQGVYTQPTFFKFATGAAFNGVMGEAGPEAVMPLTRGADGKLGVVAQQSAPNIVVNNYADATVKASTTTDEKGNKQTTLLIEKAVGGMLASGRFDTAMSSRYGARPQPVRRS